MTDLDQIFREIGFDQPPPPPPPPKRWRPEPGPCGKSAFPSESAAKSGARSLLKKGRANTSRLRAYFCDTCHAWHITSATNRP